MAAPFDQWIGKTDHQSDDVTRAAVDRHSAVTGIDNAAKFVPYGFHWCTCLPRASNAELGEDGHPKLGGFLPSSHLPLRMWASSKVQFLSPIKIGAKIERRSTIAAITPKSGKSGDLLFVDVDHYTKADGVAAVQERQTIVYRDALAQKAVLPKPAEFDLSDWETTERLTPNAAMLFRYSALTFNTHRIHYDAPYAKSVEGYPALVVHGPLMASLLLRLAAQLAGKAPITSFSFRGRAPAYCGQPLVLASRSLAQGLDMAVIDVSGQAVMSAHVDLGA